MEKEISRRIYEEPIRGGSITGNLISIIGERVIEIEGKEIEQYLYNIDGYTPKNGKPFAAHKSNIFIL